ncbi:MAG: effector binding domain-containing protein [Clostridia bacterium]|nr:effector binding domain-containing protein [Clostridia bacterium]
MKPQSISQVSKQFNVSARTLRYYEQMGLIAPIRNEENSYRIYEEDTLRTLHQIVILRKLRIPLRQISEILKSDSAKAAIDIFEENLAEIEGEITALSTIRSVIMTLLDGLELDKSKFMLPDDEKLLEIVDSLTVTKTGFREEKNMDELNRASRKLNRLTDRDVRIIYLPPCTVASAYYYGDGAEIYTGEMIDNFAKTIDLRRIHPASRHFGFNWPNPTDETGIHGYERLITVPDDIEIPAPLVKKRFEGGLFAAHMIPMGAFEEWEYLCRWVDESTKYDFNITDEGNGYHFGLFEEHLNWINYHCNSDHKDENIQLDLLIAIKEK